MENKIKELEVINKMYDFGRIWLTEIDKDYQNTTQISKKWKIQGQRELIAALLHYLKELRTEYE